MQKRAAVVGVAGLVALLGACGGSSHEAAPVTTVPIATEAPTIAVTTSTAGPTTVATVTTTTVAPYTTVPVLVRVTMTSLGDQEIVNALKALLPIQYRVALNMDVDEAVVRSGYTGQAVEDVLRDAARLKGEGKYSEVGDIDRYVVTEIRQVSPVLAGARVCFVNNGRLYRVEADGTSQLLDDKTVSRIYDFQLGKTETGWRFEGTATRSTEEGDSRCGS